MEKQRKSQLIADDVLKAYTLGYFPMSEAHDDPDIFWVLPDARGVLPFDTFHISKSLRKTMRQNRFELKIDTAFQATMEACAAVSSYREETWINDPIIEVYTQLHQAGYAHSVEAWQDGDLVGGLYGVSIAGAFFGESMFSRVTDASKVSLVYLVAILKKGGYKLLDTQFLTEHLARFGTVEVNREKYQQLLDKALQRPAHFAAFSQSLARSHQTLSGSTILQSITQTS